MSALWAVYHFGLDSRVVAKNYPDLTFSMQQHGAAPSELDLEKGTQKETQAKAVPRYGHYMKVKLPEESIRFKGHL